jgi:hypothetical protein
MGYTTADWGVLGSEDAGLRVREATSARSLVTACAESALRASRCARVLQDAIGSHQSIPEPLRRDCDRAHLPPAPSPALSPGLCYSHALMLYFVKLVPLSEERASAPGEIDAIYGNADPA